MWFLYAVAASVLWGMSYAMLEELLKKLSFATIILTSSIASLIFAAGLGIANKNFAGDWDVLKSAGRETKLMLVSIVIYIAANLFIMASINAKNATMAAMIEISYPLFTALFAWLFFRQVQVSAGTLAGAVMILAGVCCIYYFGKNI
ncbi:MAG: EamA family transporter [Alphaproteobacteria bacterium]